MPFVTFESEIVADVPLTCAAAEPIAGSATDEAPAVAIALAIAGARISS